MIDLLIALRQALYDAVSGNITEIPRVAVAFSGGVDSSLLAKICHHHYLRKQVTLVTIGFSGSHDIKFSKSMASKMGMEHKVYEIDYDDFQENLQRIRQEISCENTSHIENCIAYFYICRLAKQNDLSVVLSANGCDELFCGYDRYRRAYHRGGEAEISRLMDNNIANEFALIGEIKIVAAQLGVQVRQPFLSPRFIQFAKSIPIDQKIKGPDDMTRKHILRRTALAVGVPEESAMKPKKALQYGSSIHKYFKRVEVEDRRKIIL
ncbi:MAG: asparagine synthase C-terminal domain-containing protein [Nitrososphaera sp.]